MASTSRTRTAMYSPSVRTLTARMTLAAPHRTQIPRARDATARLLSPKGIIAKKQGGGSGRSWVLDRGYAELRRAPQRRTSENSSSETVRKGVRVALRLQIWCVYGGRNRLKQAFGRPVGLRCRLLRDFSDSLIHGVLRSSGGTGPLTVAGRASLEVSLWTQKSDSVYCIFRPIEEQRICAIR